MSVHPVRAVLSVALAASTLALGVTTSHATAQRAAQSPMQSKGAAGCSTGLLAKAQPAGVVARTQPGKFATAAGRNHAGVAAYKNLAKDKELWLDRCGKAFYVEGLATTQGAAVSRPTATVPLSDTFLLESRPGSSRTIYLDFTGDTVNGTAWNSSYGADLVAEPYSNDATVDTNFSDSELTEIQKAWQTVAEDYAPFDVNVTTKDPGLAAIDRSSSSDTVYGTRALITNGGTVYNACGCGGVAYVGVFNTTGSNHMYYQPAWVFSNGTTKSGKYMGEAIAHEVGHNFGLNHDGTATSGYYSGSAPWAPIMGASYSQPVSQWSLGEYPGANNTTQDDLAVIATGAQLLADDFANGAAGAALLGSGAPVNGIITTRTDTDAFAFTGAGATTVSVTGAAGLADLDVQLTVLDATGANIATVDPMVARVSAYAASGLDATWSATLPAAGAAYTVIVDGVGSGDPAVAGKYGDYASVGNYQISLTTQPPTGGAPLSATSTDPAAATAGTPYSATPVTASGGTTPYSFSAGGLPAGLNVDPSTGAVSGTPAAAGTWTPSITVTDAASATATRSFTLTVNPAPLPPTQVANQSFSGTVGTALSQQLVASGGNGSYAWTASGVPSGLSVSAAGVLSGTPSSSGTFTFSATASSGGTSATGTITLSVAPAPLPPTAVANQSFSGTAGTALSKQLVASGGNGTYSWTAAGVPSGLSVSASGVLSGTPSTAGTFTFTATATSGGTSATGTITLTVGAPTAPLAFSTAAGLPAAKSGGAYSTQIKVTGGVAAYSWTVSAGSLPPGLTLSWSGQTATLSGTPMKRGKATFTLRVTDGAGAVVTRTFTINVGR